MSGSKKCVVTPGVGSRLDPCQWLSALAQPSAGRSGKGVFRAELVDIYTLKPTREAWSIRSGDHTKKGVHMSFCPMCGTDLSGLFAHLLEDAPSEKEPTA
jgi:hypothetical protein